MRLTNNLLEEREILRDNRSLSSAKGREKGETWLGKAWVGGRKGGYQGGRVVCQTSSCAVLSAGRSKTVTQVATLFGELHYRVTKGSMAASEN